MKLVLTLSLALHVSITFIEITSEKLVFYYQKLVFTLKTS